jgi:cytochrome c oxidase subunit 2
LKINGHQWYWSYEISFINFDCIINKENFSFRLLETFNHLILPIKRIIQLLISSEDVIHSWTIPSLGIKIDATPGRISQSILFINRPGILIGQCREICGANHSFMPILISANSIKKFLI